MLVSVSLQLVARAMSPHLRLSALLLTSLVPGHTPCLRGLRWLVGRSSYFRFVL